VQMANTRASLPIFPGDTRITAMNVQSLEEDIPKPILLDALRKEAPHFMRTMFDFEIPEASGRMMLPVIETQGKLDAAEVNMTELDQFIAMKTFPVAGKAIKLQEFVTAFHKTLEDYQIPEWSIKEVKRELSEKYPIGMGRGNVNVIGNISFTDGEPGVPFVKVKDRLCREGEE